MKLQEFDWKKGICLGFIAGILWGWIALITNAITSAFPYESSWLYNFVTFSTGGAIFGVVVGGFMVVMEERLPFNKPLPNVVLLSTSLWIILSIGGFMLSFVTPERYHYVTAQTIQGFVMAIILGCILGFLWGKDRMSGNV